MIAFGDPADVAKHKSRAEALGDGGVLCWGGGGQRFAFPLARPEVAVLYVGLHVGAPSVTRGAGAGLVAYCAVPVAALRAGYRSCQLRSGSGKKLPLCSLLCHFARE